VNLYLPEKRKILPLQLINAIWEILCRDIDANIEISQSKINDDHSQINTAESMLDQLSTQVKHLRIRQGLQKLEKTAGEQLFEDANALRAGIAEFQNELRDLQGSD
jgi:excinuclease UvrABC helicase subunit UvrB